MAGLLAGNMLRHRSPVVVEAQPELPNNHSAVLRFRTSQVGDVLNIPFKKVRMLKAPLPWLNPVADALNYSYKCSGSYRSDRSITDGLVYDDRYIAPPGLIGQMADNCTIRFGNAQAFASGPIQISTIPMPALMKALNYRHEIEFSYVPGRNLRAKIKNCDAYVSLLVPDPSYPFSRISITGDELIVEGPKVMAEGNIDHATDLLGIPRGDVHSIEVKEQKYAKISPIDNDKRKQFLHWATTEHNIYSLGRFATWRPGLLLDDLVNDIRLIDRWSQSGNQYDVAKHRNRA